MPLEPGTKLAHYEIVSSLGAGGMGEVYRARDTKLGREVAVKLLLDEVSADPDRLARFDREARVLASLSHPNIATLLGADRDGDTHFLIMELVEGETLADRLQRGPLRVEEALPIFLQIAEGLEAAHEKGVVHRDLKPANLKLSPEGRVKILDFGLAKALTEATAGTDPSLSNSPTMTLAATMRGEILGTAAYMAPEQARGQPVDRRADVWAFGVCLFEALSGRGVFGGTTVTDTLALVLQGQPDWESLPPRTPRELVALLRRCLEKSETERLRDIGEARVLLGRLLGEGWEEPTAVADTAASGNRGRLLWTAVGVAIGLALAGALSPFWGGSQPNFGSGREPIRFTIGATEGRSFADLSDFALSPNGRHLVYHHAASVFDGGAEPLYHRPLGAFDEETVVLPETVGGQFPFFSPDSDWVGFFVGGGGLRRLERFHLAGGSTARLTEGPHGGYRATWLTNGDLIIGSQVAGLLRFDAASQTVSELVTAPAAVAFAHPYVLPGERALLFTALQRSVGETAVEILDLESLEHHTLFEGASDARYTASGHLLYMQRGDLYAVRFDLSALATVGDPFVVVRGVRTSSLARGYYEIARNGTLVYLPGGVESGGEVLLTELDLAGSVVRERGSGFFVNLQVSHDGRRVAFYSPADRGIHVAELGQPAVQVVSGELTPGHPVWSADDRSLYFGLKPADTWAIGTVLADGAIRTPEVVPGSEGRPAGPNPSSLSPDGRELLLQLRGDDMGGGEGVYGLDLETAELRLIVDTEFSEQDPQVSPRGDLLAYRSDRGGSPRVWVTSYPEPGGHVAVSVGRAFDPRWSPDGTELYYRHFDLNVMMAASIETEPEIRVTNRERLFSLDGVITFGWDTTPDGNLVVVRTPDSDDGDEETADRRLHVVLDFFTEIERLDPVRLDPAAR